mmetsp:Transcript_10650/g.22901  ORF Transcript_10650/g.22901 Transcript_10650/m.22901 type:complete len:111 (+) Transcript_10650:810-1142(+)
MTKDKDGEESDGSIQTMVSPSLSSDGTSTLVPEVSKTASLTIGSSVGAFLTLLFIIISSSSRWRLHFSQAAKPNEAGRRFAKQSKKPVRRNIFDCYTSLLAVVEGYYGAG